MNPKTVELRARTKKFAIRIVRLYSSLPKEPVAQTLGKQVLRSGTSVGANYREALRSRTKAEFISKVGDCLKEIDETEYWLELIIETGCAPESKMMNLIAEARELIAIFTAIDKTAKRVARSSSFSN